MAGAEAVASPVRLPPRNCRSAKRSAALRRWVCAATLRPAGQPSRGASPPRRSSRYAYPGREGPGSKPCMSVRASPSRKNSTETSASRLVSTKERSHHAPRRLLDDAFELVGHRLLEAAADLLDRLGLAALDERPLGLREGLLEDHNDDVFGDVRLGLSRTFAVVLALQTHDPRRDLSARVADVLLVAPFHGKR